MLMIVPLAGTIRGGADVIYILFRVRQKCSHAFRGAEPVSNALIIGFASRRFLVNLHAANRVVTHVAPTTEGRNGQILMRRGPRLVHESPHLPHQ